MAEMQELSIWTAVHLAIYIIIWVLIFCIGYIVTAWYVKRKMRKNS